ncbi:MAG: acyltransferase [Bacilli bacterium]|nr:acyltransferase [Bacilli bacterium]
MIQRKLGYFFGKIKLLLYKLFYPKRIKFKKIKFNKTSNIYIDKKSKVILGKNINMRKNISIWSTNGGTILIGDYAYINDNCTISSRNNITIGTNFHLGNNSTITDNDHDYKTSLSNFICEEVEIGDNVWCGCNVVILKGVKIGDNCVIAAGTVVNKDIPNNSMVYQERELVIKKIKK